ncbi:hypothetical protein [Flammeovirga pacifica]|uniref:Uncharacterized protein n=1 Tax=Flammeovirga pacifica TaxID=915059 RepID=A0A1S1YRW5_FLAPC|nr:hypothetical protein [Flammeovirga pacifica]OHX63780.1 hypothetical protein NH26_24940 [Flammeovirga pacifica]
MERKTNGYRINLDVNIVDILKQDAQINSRSLKKHQEHILTQYALSKQGEFNTYQNNITSANVSSGEKEFNVNDFVLEMTDFEKKTIKLRASIYNMQDIRLKSLKEVLEHRNLSNKELIEIDKILHSNYYE